VDLAGSGAKCGWVDVAGASAAVLVRLTSAGGGQTSTPLDAAASCLRLMAALVKGQPLRVIGALQHIPVLAASAQALGPAFAGEETQLTSSIELSSLSSYNAEASTV
jgi:hypothetical protein